MSPQPAPPADAALVSGEAVELDVRVARAGSRGVALLVDILVQVILLTLLGALSALVVQLMDAEQSSVPLFEGLSVLCAVLALVGYPVACETLSGGRTLGKLALGLRVVRDDGGPIRFRHALTRSLVAVAVEWPGLVLPPFTWLASLVTTLSHPRAKRLGDLAAGTIVIHERTPAAWGWVPGMPPALAGWAGTLDLTALNDDLALAVRHFLARGHGLAEPERSRLGQALAAEVAAVTTPPPPPGVPGWAYLAAVLAERHHRTAYRLAKARALAVRLWPELTASRPVPRPAHLLPGMSWAPPGMRAPSPVSWEPPTGHARSPYAADWGRPTGHAPSPYAADWGRPTGQPTGGYPTFQGHPTGRDPGADTDAWRPPTGETTDGYPAAWGQADNAAPGADTPAWGRPDNPADVSGGPSGTGGPVVSWPVQSWPEPPWREPATGGDPDADWTGMRPPPVASALRPAAGRES